MFVGLKAATTQDGTYAFNNSQRFWITNDRSRNYGHYLRLRYDAVVIGAKTAMLDNPILNIRSPYVTGRTPKRVVFDPLGLFPKHLSQLNLCRKDPTQTILVISKDSTKMAAYRDFEGQVICLPLNERGHFDWHQLNKELYKTGLRSLLIEGGGGVWKDALASDIVHKIHHFSGPNIQSNLSDQLKVVIPSPRGNLAASFEFDDNSYHEYFIT